MISRETPSSSRFHIIKIETGPYRRGRWNCRDFDESTSSSIRGVFRNETIAIGLRTSGSGESSGGRPSLHIIPDENGVPATNEALLLLTEHSTSHDQTAQHVVSSASKPPHHPSTHHHPQQHSPIPATLPQNQIKSMINNVDSHGTSTSTSTSHSKAPSKETGDTKSSALQQQAISSSQLSGIAQQQQQSQKQSQKRSQSPVTVSSTVGNSATVSTSTPLAQTVTTRNRFQVRPVVDLHSDAAAILDSIIVGSMRSGENRIVLGAGSRNQGPSSSTVSAISSVINGAIGSGSSSAGPATGSNVVAIDNKIEQAMDLVKTHLLYAVREEVEVLKEKIIDLEKKVFRLETENKLLREYAPPEILQQIQHQQQQQPPQPPVVCTSGGVNVGIGQPTSTSSATSITHSSTAASQLHQHHHHHHQPHISASQAPSAPNNAKLIQACAKGNSNAVIPAAATATGGMLSTTVAHAQSNQ